MVVRVRVEIRGPGGAVRSSAIANAAYEAGREPEILLPPALAQKIGFKLEEAPLYVYGTVGAEVDAMVLGYVDVRVVEEDRATNWVRARAVAVKGETEVLLSDRLIESFEIVLQRPASGEWRFADEGTLRKSAEAQYWS